MAGYPASALDIQNVQGLFTSVNTELQEAPVSSELVATDIAWIRQGAQALETRFSLELQSNDYFTPAPGEPIGGNLVELVEFACSLRERVMKPKKIPHQTIRGDIYGVIQPKMAPMVNQAQLIVDQDLAELILANGVNVYDGLAHWQTAVAHPYNPLRPELGKFANKFTNVNLNRAGLTRGLDYFATMKNAQGRIARKPGKKWIICSTEDQATRAAKFVQEGLIASDAGTASESTSLKDRFSGIKLFPELGDTSRGGNPKFWMVCRSASAEDRPFVVNMAQPPQGSIAGLDPNDWASAQFRSIIMNWVAHLGVGFLWPQNAVLFVET